MRRPDVALDLLEPAPRQPRWGERRPARLPVRELVAQLDPSTVDEDDAADRVRVTRRELEDDVAAPGLTGDHGPVEAERRDERRQVAGDGRHVVRAVGLRRSAVAAEVDGVRRRDRAATRALATPSHSRAFEASPWTSRNGRSLGRRGRPCVHGELDAVGHLDALGPHPTDGSDSRRILPEMAPGGGLAVAPER